MIRKKGGSAGNISSTFWQSAVQSDVKVKLSQYTPWRYTGGVDVQHLIPKLSRRRRWMVTLTTRPLYPRGKSRRYPVNRRLGKPHRGSGCCGGKKNLLRLLGFEPRLAQPVALVTILQTVPFCKHIPPLNNSSLFQDLLLQRHWRCWYRRRLLDDYNLQSAVSNLMIKARSWIKVHSSSRMKRRWEWAGSYGRINGFCSKRDGI
jgi:hypothetical protein